MMTKICDCRVALAAGLLFLAASASARADLEVVYDTNLSSGNNFVYDLIFSTGPATNGIPGQRLEAGDFATVYDFIGLQSVTPTTAGLPFTITTPLTGVTPPGTAPVDNPGITNITFTYNGPTLTTDTTFLSFRAVSSFSGLNTRGTYTGQSTKNVGLSAGTKIGAIGSTTVPTAAVPEPASMLMVGLGLAGVAALARRRRGA